MKSKLYHNPVVWADGMLVEGAHFQQLERYLTSQAHGMYLEMHDESWGIVELDAKINEFNNKKIAISKLRCIFPDGTQFDLREHETLELSLDLRQLQAEDILVVAVRSMKAPGIVYSFDKNNPSTRYHVVRKKIIDNVQKDSIKEHKNTSLLLGELKVKFCRLVDVQNDDVCVPLLRLAYGPQGDGLVKDERFGLPVLNVLSNHYLMNIMTEVENYIKRRVQDSSVRSDSIVEGSMSSIIELLLQQTFAEYRYIFQIMRSKTCLHPRALYEKLISFLGRLEVLIPSVQVEDNSFPVKYYHDDHMRTFEPLMVNIRRYLSHYLWIPTTKMEFEARGNGLYVCARVVTADIDKYVFSVSSSIDPNEFRSSFLKRVKFASLVKIKDVTDLQLPGIKLSEISGVPKDIPYLPGRVYYEAKLYSDEKLLRIGDSLAIKVLGNLSDFKFDVWAVNKPSPLK